MLNYEMEVPEPSVFLLRVGFFGTATLFFFFVCFVAVVIADPANLHAQLWSACSRMERMLNLWSACSSMERMLNYVVYAQVWSACSIMSAC